MAALNQARRFFWTGFTAWNALSESRIPFLDFEEVRAIQSARLRHMVRHAWDRIPFYRRWLMDAGAAPGDVKTADDLRRLPLLGKLPLTREPDVFSDPRYRTRDGLTLLSSGTSGYRREFRYDAHALFLALAAGRRQRLALLPFVARESGYKEAVVNRPGSAGTQIRTFWEARLVAPPGVELRRARFDPALPFPELLAGLNEFRPDVIRGIGSHLGAFLRWVVESGRRIHRPKAVTYGADAMTPAARHLIETELGIPVVATYQAVEALRIGFECEARSGYHLSTDQVEVRVVKPDGSDAGPGERGELVLSNLTNRATVVLNYRLGDLVTVCGQPCSCGRTLPRIGGIDGRLDDLIVRPDGSRLHMLSVVPSLQAVAGVHQVQIVQEDVEDFRLSVVPAAGGQPDPEELRRRILSVVGETARVSVDVVDRLDMQPSGKVKTVVCKMTEDGASWSG